MKNPQQPHREGVERLAEYLRREFPLSPVLVEPKHRMVDECPDILAWRRDRPWESLVFDWKNSLSDLKAHMGKRFVQHPSKGMGTYRLIACEDGIIHDDDIDDWPAWLGLVWFRDGVYQQLRTPRVIEDRNTLNETMMACQYIKHLERETAKQADDARPANQNRLSKDQRHKARELVHEAGSIEPKYVARDLMVPGTKDTIQKVRSSLIRDAGAGLIDGVRLEDPKTRPMLVAVEQKESV